MSYVNLHQHSHYSILDGISKIRDYLDRIENIGLPKAMALTDHGTMIGAVELLNECKSRNFKPVIGNEIYMASQDEWDAFNSKETKKLPRSHLVLLAKNRAGYESLVRMNNTSIERGYVFKSRINRQYVIPTPEILRETIEQGTVVCSTACMGGYTNLPFLMTEEYDDPIAISELRFKELISIFGKDLYAELMLLNDKRQIAINENLVKLATQNDVKPLFTCDAHYAHPEQYFLREYAMAMNWKTPLSVFRGIMKEQKDSGESLEADLYIKTPEELLRMYLESEHANIIPEGMMQEAVGNSTAIVDEIETFSLDAPQSLHISHKYEGYERYEDLDTLFLARIKKGYDERVVDVIPEDQHEIYDKRLRHEVDIMFKKGFVSYFVILSEIIDEFKKRGYLVGAGRGSAVGSLVCYLMGISEIDPIKYDLLFERFLDLSRNDYPDIDVDFEDRKIAIQIAREILPHHNVVQISNRNCFHLKTMVRSFIKLFGSIDKKLEPLRDADSWIKIIDDNHIETVEEFFAHDEIKIKNKFCFEDSKMPEQELFEIFENSLNNISAHAGGIVIVDKNDYTIPYSPLMGNEISNCVTSFCESMNFTELEQIGYIKFDMLGVANLRVIHAAVDAVCENREWSNEEIYKFLSPINQDFSDSKVYKNFHNAYTDGIFQFGSDGMKSLLSKLKPNNIIDLAIANALHRPGPLEADLHLAIINSKDTGDIGAFVDDVELMKFIEDILEETYGYPVFEEQIMQMGQRIADYDGTELNKFRKFLKSGKHLRQRDPDEYKKQTEQFYGKFMKGGEEKGFATSTLEELWILMEGFSKYSFNKSHALSYAVLAYQSMWLATYCSGEWYSAVLSHATGDVDLQRIMKTIKKRNLDVQVKPPRVNKSGIGYRFDKDENTIYIGLDMVKGIGPRSAGELLKITEEISSFRQFYKNKEYLKRIVNKKVVYTLIRVGFFDDINPDRNMVTAEFMQLHEKGYKKKEVDEIYEQELVENYGDLEFYKAEEAAFGMGFSPHPLTYMKKHINEIQDCLEEEQIAIACLVNKIQYKKTKKEKDYIFMNVDSPQVGSVGVFVWKGFEPYKKKIKEDTSLIMIVKPGWKDGMYDMHDAIDVSSGEVKVL